MRERENPDGVRGAGFWVRAFAHLVDVTLLTGILCVLGLTLFIRMAMSGTTRMPDWMRWVEIPFDLLLLFGVVLLWHKTQTTPGKKLFGLRIVDSRTGGRPSWKQLYIRYFGYLLALLPMVPIRLLERIVPPLERLGPPLAGLLGEWDGWQGWLFGPPLGFGFLWILADRRHRGWHDLVSGTVTLRGDDPGPGAGISRETDHQY